jgi:hypothetical protein
MSEYAPLRDAFHEINRLLIDKQQWDAKHELDKEEMGLKRMMQEQQIQDQQLKRATLEKDAMEARSAVAPTKVNIREFTGGAWNSTMHDTIHGDNTFENNLARVWGGSRIDQTTGDVMDDRGNPIMLPKFEVGQKSVAALALINGRLDPQKMIEANQSTINQAIQDRRAELNKIQDLPINAASRGKLTQEIERLKGEYTKHERMKEPDGMIKLLSNQLELTNGFANQAIMMGANKNFTDIMKNTQDGIQSQILKWMDVKRVQESEKSADRRMGRAPVQLIAHQLDKDGQPTGQSRYIFTTADKFSNAAVRPMDIDNKLGEDWAWTMKPQKAAESFHSNIPHMQLVHKERTAPFSKVVNGEIIIDPQWYTAAQMSDFKAGPLLTSFYKNANADEVNRTSPTDLANAINQEVKVALAKYYETQAKTYFDEKMGNQDSEKTRQAMQAYNEAFFKEWGIYPRLQENPLIRNRQPNVKLQQSPVAPSDVSGGFVTSGGNDYR